MKARDVMDAYFEAVDGGDVDGVLALFDPNVVYERPGYQPIGS